MAGEGAKDIDSKMQQQREHHRAMCAKCRVLYKDAPIFLKSLDLQRAALGNYLPIQALVDALLRSCGEGPETKDWQGMCAAANRALGTALLEQFGHDLPRVHLSKGSCTQTQERGCTGFGVESADFPSRAVRLEEGEASAARAIRKEKRLKDGDLPFRPAAERGSTVVLDNPAMDPSKGGSSSQYLSELLSLACGPELLKLRLYPDAKELTESFAAFNAVRKHMGSSFLPDDPTVTVICVGDGSLPRTAALFAFRTKWQCYAVDPQMRQPGVQWGGIDRLQAMTAKIEDCKFSADRVLVVCVHAHVGLEECIAVMDWKKALGIVVMPCCNYYSRLTMSDNQTPLAEYYDTGVVSPHRLIRVYLLEE